MKLNIIDGACKCFFFFNEDSKNIPSTTEHLKLMGFTSTYKINQETLSPGRMLWGLLYPCAMFWWSDGILAHSSQLCQCAAGDKNICATSSCRIQSWSHSEKVSLLLRPRKYDHVPFWIFQNRGLSANKVMSYIMREEVTLSQMLQRNFDFWNADCARFLPPQTQNSSNFWFSAQCNQLLYIQLQVAPPGNKQGIIRKIKSVLVLIQICVFFKTQFIIFQIPTICFYELYSESFMEVKQHSHSIKKS